MPGKLVNDLGAITISDQMCIRDSLRTGSISGVLRRVSSPLAMALLNTETGSPPWAASC